MRTILAEKLLAKIMGWTQEEVTSQRPLLQALSSFKYDEYQQFSPGIRFIESLAKWLEQFKTPEHKKQAYSFVVRRLVFISNEQMTHLVNLTFTDKINPILIEKTASLSSVEPYLVNQIVDSPTYRELLRRGLIIGLSDGARIDLLRRSKKEISNEQVFPSYYIELDKEKDMIKELHKLYPSKKFNTVFLVDDFTASGKSYFRASENTFKGKIYKFLDKHINGAGHDLIEVDENLSVHVIFYVATNEALTYLRNEIEGYVKTQNLNIRIDVNAVQIIDDKVKNWMSEDSNFFQLISQEDYFDESIVDSHYKEGKHDSPYLGFNECALPLILSHNTPNNSLPILWFPEGAKLVGLFPRVTRHKDE